MTLPNGAGPERRFQGLGGALRALAAAVPARKGASGEGRENGRVSVRLLDDPWADLRHELGRSRRYERSFVLVRLPCNGSASGGSGFAQRAKPCREQALQLSAFLRSVDRAWTVDGAVYVLLPESDRAMGEAFLARIRQQAPEVLPEEGVRLVAFPGDGLTSGALLEALNGQPVPAAPGPRRKGDEATDPGVPGVVSLHGRHGG